jgi:2-polyprenyl-6-hydroxyphenyl methylase/3-demethylubiquinone-9 3-methyltransferase
MSSERNGNSPAVGAPIASDIPADGGADARFRFGENWKSFLRLLDDERIEQAEKSVADLLGDARLDGSTLLDVGCGSGLFSLAARRMGARVTSFDYDADSVDCAIELRRRFFPDDPDWTVMRGSILDRQFVQSLGQFDHIYAWGVLHHTGAMWPAIENVRGLAAPGGRVVLAIYNDCGLESRVWRGIKRTYCRTPRMLQPILAAATYAPYEVREAVSHLRRGKLRQYWRTWTGYRERRGMSKWVDIVDWVCGYPYECATPEEVLEIFTRAENQATVNRSTETHCSNQLQFTSTAKPPTVAAFR